MTTEKKMTKKETEETLGKVTADLEAVVAAYNQLQADHGRRLMYLRILETFVNQIDAGLGQVKRDIAEINATLQEQTPISMNENEVSQGTGEEL